MLKKKEVTESYKPILKDAKTICLCNPATNPLYKYEIPSCLDTLRTQSISPLYLTASPGFS